MRSSRVLRRARQCSWRRAVAEPPPEAERGELLAELGRAEVRAGEFGEGISHLDGALRLLGPERAAGAHRDRVYAAFARRGWTLRRVRSGKRLRRSATTPVTPACPCADLALLAWLSGSDHGLDLERHGELAGATTAERTVLAIRAQEAHSSGDDPDAAVMLAERALGGGRLIAEDTAEALSWFMALYALLSCEAHDAASRDHRRRPRRRGPPRLGLRPLRRARGPRRARAQRGPPMTLRRTPERPPRRRDPSGDGTGQLHLVLALTDQGEIEDAAAELEAAGLATGPGGPTVMRWMPWARARLREAQGDDAGVREAVTALAADDAEGKPRALAWRALLARSLSAREPAEATTLAAEHHAWASRWGTSGRARCRRARGRVDGDRDRARGSARGGGSPCRSSLRTEEARARLDLGVALLRAGRRREGRGCARTRARGRPGLRSAPRRLGRGRGARGPPGLRRGGSPSTS
ncbi:MAG: hypothetical protein U0R24_04845 [Solirubrobacterales bacterium]